MPRSRWRPGRTPRSLACAGMNARATDCPCSLLSRGPSLLCEQLSQSLEDVIRWVGRLEGFVEGCCAGEDEGACHACFLCHAHVGGEAVACEDCVRSRDAETIED